MNTPFSAESIANFLKALVIMGQGMLGIFVIMMLIALSIILIRKLAKVPAPSDENL